MVKNLHREREVACSECNSLFISRNFRTHRCDECKKKNLRIPKTFKRVCCECGVDFITRNIYTITCSNKCGHIASNNGNAQIAKELLIAHTHAIKEDRQRTKDKYQERLVTEQEIIDYYTSNWSQYDFNIIGDISYGCEIEIICKEHGSSTTTYSRGRRSADPCKGCRDRYSFIVNWNTLSDNPKEASKDAEVYLMISDDYLKVGITQLDIKTDRKTRLLRDGGFDSYEVIYKGTLEDCFELEQLILNEANNYIPDKKFGGYTECFKTNFMR